jgi:hypothetical protein
MNSETDEIDKKKNPTKNEDEITASTFIKYIIIILIVILLVYGYFGTGGFMLYACKLAQSNILPTDVNCFPYTSVETKIDPSNINIFTTSDNPPLSEKIQFPYDNDNKKYIIIDMMKSYKESSNANFLACYFISIMENFMSNNYSLFNAFFNILNKNLSENAIMFLGPIMMLMVAPFLIIIDYLYFVYLWFSNMNWFFQTNTNDAGEGPPVWENVGIKDTTSYILSIVITFIFGIVGIILALSGAPLLITLIIIGLTLFTIITYKSKLNNAPANLFTIIKNVLKLYKVPFNIIISLFVVLFAFTNINPILGIIALISIGIIYYRGTPDMYIPNILDRGKLSALTTYDQANKVRCKPPPKKEMLGVFSEIKDEVKNTVKSAYDSLPGYSSIPGYGLYSSIPSVNSLLDFWGFNKKNKNLTKEIIKVGGRLNPRPNNQ